MEIKTNHRWRELLSFYELPAKFQKVAKADMDWIDQEDLASPLFFVYRNTLHHLDEYMFTTGQFEKGGWNGYQAGTYFSGTLVRIHPEGDHIMVARYVVAS